MTNPTTLTSAVADVERIASGQLTHEDRRLFLLGVSLGVSYSTGRDVDEQRELLAAAIRAGAA